LLPLTCNYSIVTFIKYFKLEFISKMEDPWAMKEIYESQEREKRKMKEKQRKNIDAYVDNSKGITMQKSLYERENITAPTEREIYEAKLHPIYRAARSAAIAVGTVAGICLLTYVLWKSGCGKSTLDKKTKSEDAHIEKMLKEYPKEPYRGE
jgi:hypothetical protein